MCDLCFEIYVEYLLALWFKLELKNKHRSRVPLEFKLFNGKTSTSNFNKPSYTKV